ncbi:MAG: hypothetical protein U9R14_01480 [Patescibacteria group bacterium]|nr:hypothetical protein [Patescibacteria group bacterium]
MNKIIIRKPDNMHVHLREGPMLTKVIMFTSYVYSRAVIMGNLKNPVDTPEKAMLYKSEILRNAGHPGFIPLMTLMITKNTNRQTVKDAKKEGIVGFKFIPANTSTGSEDIGLNFFELFDCIDILKEIRDQNLMFLVHSELIRDRQGNIIPLIKREETSIKLIDLLVDKVPGLKITIEHITTRKYANYILGIKYPFIWATITAHHPYGTYDMVCDKDGIIKNPELYCLPIFKSEDDQQAIIKAMISGNLKFFCGEDTAPHYFWDKIKPPYRPGLFTAPVGLILITQIFEKYNALGNLENFTSRFGAEAHDLPLNQGKITLIKKKWTVPLSHEGINIFKGGETLHWQIAS